MNLASVESFPTRYRARGRASISACSTVLATASGDVPAFSRRCGDPPPGSGRSVGALVGPPGLWGRCNLGYLHAADRQFDRLGVHRASFVP
jgi:hypothetical protein